MISGSGVCGIRERCLCYQGAVFVISGSGVCDIRVHNRKHSRSILYFRLL